jgi:hypothetical protein
MGNSLLSGGKRPVLLLGSVPLASARNVFEAVAASLGDLVRRIPDGETGPRWNWIVWQSDVIRATEGFETGGTRQVPGVGRTFDLQRLKTGVAAKDIEFGPLGYSKAALDSYQTFSQLRANGKIPTSARFQVSLPTPIAIAWSFFVREAVRPIWPVYEAKLFQEVDEIARAIPHEDLAIQWDAAIEFACILEVPEEAKFYGKQELISAIARCVDRVPADVEAGVHFCYGDPGHKHLVEPKDTGLMVELGNGVTAASRRPFTWLHIPVPRNRDDDLYFASLRTLSLKPETELYLGLVHYTDGIEGAKRRLAAAKKVVSDFGIATECGFGRRPSETIPELLALHREIALLG